MRDTMKFLTPESRKQHPQASLIPSQIWRYVQNTFDGDVIEIMKNPSVENIKKYLREDTQRRYYEDDYDSLYDFYYKNSKDIWICCAFREPQLSSDELLKIADVLRLTAEQRLVYSCVIGRMDLLQKIISSDTFVEKNVPKAFERAVSYGHLAIVNMLLAIPGVGIHANSVLYNAIKTAARKGDLPIVERLLLIDDVEFLRRDNVCAAFVEAASNGHLSIMEKLLAIPGVDILEMIKTKLYLVEYGAFVMAAENGHLPVIEKLMSIPGVDTVAQFKSNHYRAARMAARNGHLSVIEKFLAINVGDINFYYSIFLGAVSTGQIEIMEKILSMHELILTLVTANDYKAFIEAASNGHLLVIEKLLSIPGVDRLEMVKAGGYRAFINAASSGHLPIFEKLMSIPGVDRLEMAKADGYRAFTEAASRGYFVFMEKILSVPGVDIEAMVRTDDYRAFRRAVEENYDLVVRRLLLVPAVFAYAVQHQEYFKYTKTFMTEMLEKLEIRQLEHHSSIVLTRQETEICFYCLVALVRELQVRHSISFSEKTLKQIDFLISIPLVQSILHRSIIPNRPNAPLREAMRLGNQALVNRLMNIPAVYEQAERDGFYPLESRGQIDLRTIAEDRESSMVTLAPQEQSMLQRLETKYTPFIQKAGLKSAFNKICSEIIKRYENNPALIKRDSGEEISLPLKKADFDELLKTFDLSESEKSQALEAYYRHTTHTVFRYLSKPNPWMAPNSSYVYVNDAGERWSTFESFIPMIVLLWIAANDPDEPPTDGFSLETRVDEIIREIALIARAHNWDARRQKQDAEGRSIVDNAGQPLYENYDDLKGDKPSCFGGVKRRLFQALKGHPLYLQDVQSVVSLALHQRLREHMQQQFQQMNTVTLEAVQVNQMKLMLGEKQEDFILLTKKWDVPSPKLKQWAIEIQQKYGPLYDNDAVQQYIDGEIKIFFKNPYYESHFLCSMSRCQLNALCQKEYQSRTDGLKRDIQTLPVATLPVFLQQTDVLTGERRLMKAIRLGLLEDIGTRLDKETFTHLLYPDDDTADIYASVLADTTQNKEQINRWLFNVEEAQQKKLIEKINENDVVVYKPNPFEALKHFVLNAEQNSETKKLLVRLNQLKTDAEKAKVSEILNDWFMQYAENPFCKMIQVRAIELGFDVSIRSTPLTSLSLFSPTANQEGCTPSERAELAFENLPDDRTGRLLGELELVFFNHCFENIENLSDRAKNNSQLVRWMYKKDPTSLRFAGKKALLDLFETVPLSLEYVSNAHKQDPDIVLVAYRQDHFSLSFADISALKALLNHKYKYFVYEGDIFNELLRRLQASNYDNDVSILSMMDKDSLVLVFTPERIQKLLSTLTIPYKTRLNCLVRFEEEGLLQPMIRELWKKNKIETSIFSCTINGDEALYRKLQTLDKQTGLNLTQRVAAKLSYIADYVDNLSFQNELFAKALLDLFSNQFLNETKSNSNFLVGVPNPLSSR